MGPEYWQLFTVHDLLILSSGIDNNEAVTDASTPEGRCQPWASSEEIQATKKCFVVYILSDNNMS